MKFLPIISSKVHVLATTFKAHNLKQLTNLQTLQYTPCPYKNGPPGPP